MTQALRLPRSDTLRFPAGARCIAYVRVSTERQAGETKVSPETQLARCTTLAVARGYSVDHVVEDHESGAHLERLDRLVKACAAHRLPPGTRGLIVVYDTSRWGRFERPGVDRMFREQLYRLGWDVSLGDAPETGNEAADLFVGTGQAIASTEYRRQLRQKVVDNMPRVAAQGYWQGRAPFGYAIAETDGGRRKLVKGSERDVATVRRIFARFNAGVTLQAIAAELHADKVPGPFDQYPSHTWRFERRRAPCGRWTSSAVRSLLGNETYTGRIVFKPREVRDEKGKPIRFARNHVPEEHWVVVENAHPVLVERRIFETARRRLLDKAKPRKGAGAKEPYVLSGLIQCATCDGPIIGGGGGKPSRDDPGATRSYRCRNAVAEMPTCSKPILTINQRWLEREVVARVSTHVQQLVKSGALAKLLDERLGADDGASHAAQLGRELQQLEAQRRTLVEKIAKGLLSDDDARAVLADIKTRIAVVGRDMQAARVKPTRSDRKVERDRLLQLAADFPALIKKVPAPVARELLSHWVEGVTLDKKGRLGTLTLRTVPADCLTSGNQARRDPARRCWRAGCPRSSPR
jgi:DNA invertase Pin-like site-specific DNA recombinase